MSLTQYIYCLPAFYQRETMQKKVRNYFRSQPFTPEERSMLIDWMLACIDFYFEDSLEIFFLAVAYFDVYMSSKNAPSTTKWKLQCTGASCIWLASHHLSLDENKTADFLDLVTTVDPKSLDSELQRVFISLFDRFQRKPHLLTAYHFLTTYLVILRLGSVHNITPMSFYILELSQYDETICVAKRYKPSLIATAAIYTGLVALKLTNEWISDLSILTPYKDDHELTTVHKRMLTLLKAVSPSSIYKSVYNRYSREKNHHVSLIDYSFIS